MSSREQETMDRARALSNWYVTSLRRFFEEHAPQNIAQLDNENLRVQRLLSQDPETVVCFVGASGIGKSTLLNAIVAGERTLAPAGGVGPLTALATEVRHGETPRLRAEYHSKQRLWRVASALYFQIERSRKAQTGVGATARGVIDEQLELDAQVASDVDNEGSSKAMDEFLRIARLMVGGSQDADRPIEYLADALAIACSNAPRCHSELSLEDAPRIEQIKAALALAENKQAIEQNDTSSARFRETLKDHAAGFLSPLISRVEVRWPSDVLKSGLVLVDLPGVGVAGDVYKGETQRFVREKARAVVLVVDRAGLTESVMELLKTTGYWDRLVLASDDPEADPCALIVVVTKVDDNAAQEWRDLDADASGRRPKSKAQVFADVQAKLKDGLGKQFQQHIKDFTVTQGSDAIREGRESAARHLLRTLQIHPVSAVQYRLIVAANEDDPPFLRSPDDTGIPGLAGTLLGLAHSRTEQRTDALNAINTRFAESLSDQLASIEESWKSDRAAEEAERIRAALRVVLEEKNLEYESRRASFRTFLKETVPEKIKVAVHEAKDEAEKDVNRYLRALQDAHWATLKAAVTRGGTFHGSRYINLPSDIALKFQDPIAAVWSQELLKPVRKETYQLAAAIKELVEEICDRASLDHAAYLDPKVVERQKKSVSAQVEQLRDVGKEAVEDLRDVVKNKIVESIRQPIQRACEQFVNEGKHIGTGVKNRILEMFRDLAANATDAASSPTRKVLLTKYGTVEVEIRKAFDDWGQPLEAATNALVERHEDRVRRSDRQRRQKVLSEIERLRVE